MSFLINPYAFLAAGGDFESIATVTVGSGGASSIEFTSIPSTYQHLQVRFVLRGAGTGSPGVTMTLNSDTGSNYAWHRLYGDGSSATADGYASETYEIVGRLPNTLQTANVFGVGVVDILDYGDTSKNSTSRVFAGMDNNGSGLAMQTSGLWADTTAITAISLSANQNFVEHSTAALYGLKA